MPLRCTLGGVCLVCGQVFCCAIFSGMRHGKVRALVDSEKSEKSKENVKNATTKNREK
jgi:hypothetical protein